MWRCIPSCKDRASDADSWPPQPTAAVTWPANSIRLDAYDDPAGAGGFYRACRYREVAHVTYRDVPLLYYELLLPVPRIARGRLR